MNLTLSTFDTKEIEGMRGEKEDEWGSDENDGVGREGGGRWGRISSGWLGGGGREKTKVGDSTGQGKGSVKRLL